MHLDKFPNRRNSADIQNIRANKPLTLENWDFVRVAAANDNKYDLGGVRFHIGHSMRLVRIFPASKKFLFLIAFCRGALQIGRWLKFQTMRRVCFPNISCVFLRL